MTGGGIIIMQGDNRERLREFPDASFDSCVCDPPYELGFMGKKWDSSGISFDVEMWREVLRVLKPGAYLLAFGGSRTYHRLVCAIEDAGFEIRDQMQWIFGSGFPKNLDVSKAIDKAIYTTRTANPDFQKVRAWVRAKVKAKGLTYRQIDKALGNENSHKASHYLDNSQPQLPTPADWEIIKGLLDLEENDLDRPPKLLIETFEREIIGYRQVHKGLAFTSEGPDQLPITKPMSPKADQWSGWGTALKPAHEPIVVARKPLEGTVVANVLKHGTGAINVAGCRIEGPEPHHNYGRTSGEKSFCGEGPVSITPQDGRWPANVIHDGSPEVMTEFEKAGVLKSGSGTIRQKEGYFGAGDLRHGGLGNAGDAQVFYGDKGSPARFFYCAKASQEERNRGCETIPFGEPPASGRSKPAEGRQSALGKPRGNHHPTVKPLALMAYLVRLVTPPGGVVLDPFMGSGSTLIAAAKEGFDSVGIDLELENLEIAKHRCQGHLGMLAEVVNQ